MIGFVKRLGAYDLRDDEKASLSIINAPSTTFPRPRPAAADARKWNLWGPRPYGASDPDCLYCLFLHVVWFVSQIY
jgi:hypothetical protein